MNLHESHFAEGQSEQFKEEKKKNGENKITWQWAETNPDNLKVIRNILTPEC